MKKLRAPSAGALICLETGSDAIDVFGELDRTCRAREEW